MPEKLSDKARRFNFWLPKRSADQLHFLLVQYTIEKPKMRWTLAQVLLLALDKLARSRGWSDKGLEK